MDEPKGRSAEAPFLTGSLGRHLTVMTASGYGGLAAVYLVDALTVFYISLLSRDALLSGLGAAMAIYAFAVALNIGLGVTASATVSRSTAVSSGRQLTREATTAALIVTLAIVLTASILLLMFSDKALRILGLDGEALEQGGRFLFWVLIGNVALSLAMVSSSVLRGLGRPGRAMKVTLAGALSTAVFDPILILGLGLELEGAGIAIMLGRFVHAAAGLYYLYDEQVLGFINYRTIRSRARELLSVAVPTVVSGLAVPIGVSLLLLSLSQFGDTARAAFAVADRVAKIAFGPAAALAGALGPVVAQNFWAGFTGRARNAIIVTLIGALVYGVACTTVISLLSTQIAALFSVPEKAVGLVTFLILCRFAVGAFDSLHFSYTAVLQNTGVPAISMYLSWARCSVGVLPAFVATYFSPSVFATATGYTIGQIGVTLAGLAVLAIIVSKWPENSVQKQMPTESTLRA